MSGSFLERNFPSRQRPALAAVQPTPAPTPAPGEDEDQEDMHPCRSFAILRGLTARAHKLEFRFLEPNRPDEILDFSWLPRISWWKAQGAIVLHYPSLGVRVTIRGLNLWRLKDYLGRQRVLWVQENGDDPLTIKELQIAAEQAGEVPVIVTWIDFEAPPDTAYGEEGAEREEELEEGR